MQPLLNTKEPSLFFTQYRVLWHILFWIGLLVYEVLIWGMVDNAYYTRFIPFVIELPVKMLAVYFTLYVLIDKFFIRKRYGAFVLLLLLSMAFIGVVLRIIGYYVIYPMFYPDGLSIPLFFLPKILIAIFVTYSLVAIVATFHLIKHHYEHQRTTQLLRQTADQLEKEKLAAELKLLKSQINPHFLFNTLNNLYALTLNNSAKAPEMVHKLSQLMSYMLYDNNQPEVPLVNEIQYIRNYIALEKIRYGDRLEVSLNVYENIDNIMIAPLMILPFVENSFKHGVSHELSKCWIHIDIELQEKMLVIKAENSKPDFTDEMKRSSGIGLENVKKRLQHLYPDAYSLQLFDEPDTYLAVLKLKLSRQMQPVTEESFSMGT
jgi:sensor histidine kinase YesM